MALKKNKELLSGAVASYHRLSSVSMPTSNRCHLQVDSYKDEEARDSNKAPMQSSHLSLSKEGLDLSQNLLSQLYEKLKELPEFENSEDA